MRTTDNINYMCDEGKMFRHKENGMIMGNGLSLGENDSIDNYEEVDEPDYKPKTHRRMRHEL